MDMEGAPPPLADGETSVGAKEVPFIRSDRYGELGLSPQPWTENLRLLLFAIFLVPLKVAGALGCLLSYWSVIKLSVLFPPSKRTEWIATLGEWHCRGCLFCIGFLRIEWVKVPPATPPLQPAPAPVAIVSNHCSWVDILVHMSRSFPSFVARDATRRTPFIGSISEAMGCVYVDRSKRPVDSAHPGVAAVVKQRMTKTAAGQLPDARPLLLFPEGTTSNGNFMLPFKTGAFLAGVPLQPVLLRYATRSISPAWETIGAIRHIALLLCNPVHSLTAYELPVYVPSPEESADPRLFADNVRHVMVSKGGSPGRCLALQCCCRAHKVQVLHLPGRLTPVMLMLCCADRVFGVARHDGDVRGQDGIYGPAEAQVRLPASAGSHQRLAAHQAGLRAAPEGSFHLAAWALQGAEDGGHRAAALYVCMIYAAPRNPCRNTCQSAIVTTVLLPLTTSMVSPLS